MIKFIISRRSMGKKMEAEKWFCALHAKISYNILKIIIKSMRYIIPNKQLYCILSRTIL